MSVAYNHKLVRIRMLPSSSLPRVYAKHPNGPFVHCALPPSRLCCLLYISEFFYSILLPAYVCAAGLIRARLAWFDQPRRC